MLNQEPETLQKTRQQKENESFIICLLCFLLFAALAMAKYSNLLPDGWRGKLHNKWELPARLGSSRHEVHLALGVPHNTDDKLDLEEYPSRGLVVAYKDNEVYGMVASVANDRVWTSYKGGSVCGLEIGDSVEDAKGKLGAPVREASNVSGWKDTTEVFWHREECNVSAIFNLQTRRARNVLVKESKVILIKITPASR